MQEIWRILRECELERLKGKEKRKRWKFKPLGFI